jgi:dimethylhistidine N-methyltransferase
MRPLAEREIGLDRGFADAVRHGLTAIPRQLDPKYFYDDLGSALFDAICRLPWYPITRAEFTLLQHHAAEILAATSDRTSIVELGCGTGEKLLALVEACRDRVGTVHLLDISPAALQGTERRLERAGFAHIASHVGPYEDAVGILRGLTSAPEPMLVLFLGSNIGNFEPATAMGLLADLATSLRPVDSLLLGVDLVKPEQQLLEAYDDPLGVTAAFNLNLLLRMNRELRANFDLTAWSHRAIWNESQSRVEMHLASTRDQRVDIGALDFQLQFNAGETIWTESSYKYDPSAIIDILQRTGFEPQRQWIDERARFSLTRAARNSVRVEFQDLPRRS